MENNIDFETRFLLNIGKCLHEHDYISIEEITEYENIVKKETENNDWKIDEKEKRKMMRADVYCRVSTLKEEQQESIAHQMEKG